VSTQTYMATHAVDHALETQLFQLKRLRTVMLAVNEKDPRVRSLDTIVEVITDAAKVVRDLGAALEEV